MLGDRTCGYEVKCELIGCVVIENVLLGFIDRMCG